MTNKIYVITVTYGNRWHYLEKVLSSAVAQKVDRIFVVDNGSPLDIGQLVLNRFGDQIIEVIRLEKNIGSAGGFKAGFIRAMDNDPDYILLLDDDNQLEENAINAFKECYSAAAVDSPSYSLAIMGFRESRFNLGTNKINHRRSSYFGFHILDIPYKICKVLNLNSFAERNTSTKELLLSVAPWSGLFFHKSLVTKHGYPEENFVLYADDTEYTKRISDASGKIILCTNARLRDLDQSWSVGEKYSNYFDSILRGEGDFRAYYTIRNNNYLEYNRNKDKNLIHFINRTIFKLILVSRAISTGRLSRLKLILKAMSDGKAGKLGVDKSYPIL